ncbi:MAG: hypothetical protein Ct9H300mP28_34950 [Pseudomonadota bacterium]|nr:MAG: hypothetical protein Ct9H300mP28_34950 [Pseudomonadota bacterium]
MLGALELVGKQSKRKIFQKIEKLGKFAVIYVEKNIVMRAIKDIMVGFTTLTITKDK